MYKISKIGALALGVLGALLWILLVSSDMTNPSEAINNTPMQWMFIVSYVLLAVAVLVAVISGAKNVLSSPKALKKTLIYTGAFVVIVGLSYAFAGGDGTEKLVSAGLISFYILTTVAVGLLVVSGVKNALIK
ncbi:hypothetical protein [Capnocytophaga cynodegmi]|uniref:hypothetical protein n=1 Tax=Capnocytophaga cynodegmi TaxID=28189 RepID=UPI001AD2C83B|nr:hypothetical protein [Capnocytophaga cynodegmi]GIM53274.1 hypothetical protein CAPN004_23040 [Capnocytophaga cynodegmi]GIM53362.1 hypothetical protein CAPN005_00090 [Capnocytophaga cynodegmi]